ncbi:MAG TPA: hypothetical protein VH082_08885 [Rudaea sp.]|jgi:hypothetical protein|nr:hypothetical protein [Rudaea sp.]
MSSTAVPALGERRYYLTASLILIAVTLAGFSIDADLVFHLDQLSALVLLHGLLMFGWLAMFATQVTLVAVGRVDLHRRLGVAGTVLAATLVVVGIATIVVAVKLGGDHMPPHMAAAPFLASAFELLFTFGVLVAFGIGLRRRRDYHKRLMLLATIPLLDAAIVRFVGTYTTWTFDPTDIRNGIIALCVVVDTIRCRRLHPAFLAGAAFILICDQIANGLAVMPAWEHFTAWVAS